MLKIKKLLGLHTRNEEELVKKDRGNQSYYWMLSFATILATLGILIDNSTVIIGAMLIAPLMVPISSLSVSIAKGKSDQLLKSLSHLSISLLIILVISLAMGRLIPVVGIPKEALVRARPNFVDLLIAIAAGSAGMYAFLRKDISESLAGVAIAVSLLPPLSVVGVGLALGNWAVSVGATVLFFTNVIAIISASLVVLLLHGKSARSEQEKGVAATGWGVTVSIVVILAILLGGVFISTFQEEQTHEQVESTIEKFLAQYDRVELDSLDVTTKSDQILVDATIRLPESEATPDLDVLTNALSYTLAESVQVNLSLIRFEQAQRDLSSTEKDVIRENKHSKVTSPDEEVPAASAAAQMDDVILPQADPATAGAVSSAAASLE